MAWFLQILSFVELFWILQQWKLDDNIVSHLLEHEHTKSLLYCTTINQQGGDHLTKRVNDKVGGIIEPEEAPAGVKHCAPGKRKKQNYKSRLSNTNSN